jgi:hypothetical protein
MRIERGSRVQRTVSWNDPTGSHERGAVQYKPTRDSACAAGSAARRPTRAGYARPPPSIETERKSLGKAIIDAI